MTEWYPDPKKFLKCEQETLIFLKDRPSIAKHFAELKKEAEKRYASYEKIKSKILEFESEIGIDLSSKKTKNKPGIANISAYIETGVEGLNKISYNLDIIDKSHTPSKILRKFHFDYDSPGMGHRCPHPIIHLQYAGKLSKKIEDMKLAFKHLDKDMDKPRLCYFPMSLALLINLVFIDFPSDDSIKLCGTPEWRDLIRKNENIVLKPFFERCQRFFSSRKKDHLFVNDFYYGKCTN